MAGINKKLITIPELASFDDVRQALAKAVNDLQDSITNQLPITNYQSKRITNVGSPQAPDDVVTLKYLQSGATPTQSIPVVNPNTSAGGSGGGGGGGTTGPYTEIPAGTIDGTNATFTVTRIINQKPSPILELNGAIQDPLNSTVDFTTTGTQIIYTTPPEVGAKHVVWYWSGQTTNNARLFDGNTARINWGTNTAFNLQSDMSLGLWVKIPSNGSGNIINYRSTDTTERGPYFLYIAGSSGAWNMEYVHDLSGVSTYVATFTTTIPNDTWSYVGFTRDNTLKTVTFYQGYGNTINTIGTSTYVTGPVGGTEVHASLNIGQVTNFLNTPGFALRGAVEEHYLATTKWSSTDHTNAMKGSPPASGLLLACKMGNTPEVDISGNGYSGDVTATTFIPGH